MRTKLAILILLFLSGISPWRVSAIENITITGDGTVINTKTVKFGATKLQINGVAIDTALDGKQPLDTDLTQIAGVATTAYGRNALAIANASDFRTYIGAGTGSGTVTSASVVTANGVSATVATATTTPAFTFTLGAITPSSVNGNTITPGSGTLTLGAVTLNAGPGGTLGTAAFTASGDYATAAQGAKADTAVQSLTVTTANGVSGSFTGGTTPALSLTLGAITPSSVAASGNVTGLNLSGTNTGDQTSIVGITGTVAQFNTALTDGDFATGGGTATGTNTGDQVVPVNTTATASQFFTAYNSGNGAFTKAQPAFSDLSGSIAIGQVPNDLITYAKIQNISANRRVLGRLTTGAGDTEELTLDQVLDFASPAHGDILFRGAAGWQLLVAGTAGDVLTTHGPGADPTYETPSGGGTGGVIGTATFAGGDPVSSLVVDGVVSAVAYQSLGLYIITITGQGNANYIPLPSCSDVVNGITANVQSKTSTDFTVMFYDPRSEALVDPLIISVAVLRLSQ